MNFSVNNNMAATMTLNNLANTQNQLQNAVAQLSSGYRINKAADDAAGLAISQKMQAQINGLNQASQNAQNGVSLIQTAEGTLGQSQSILQSMRTLAVQASTVNTASDRAKIQLSMDQLAQQLTQNSNNAQYNTMHILTGQFAKGQNDLSIQVGANQGEVTSFNIGAADAYSLGVTREYAKVDANATTPNSYVNGSATAANSNVSVGAQTSISANGDGTDITNVGDNIAANSAYKLVYNSTFDSAGKVATATLQLQDSAGNNIGAAVDLTKASNFGTGASAKNVTIGDAADGISFTVATTTGVLTAGTSGTGIMGETETTTGSTASYSQIDTLNTIATATASHAASAMNGWSATATAGISVLNQGDASNAISAIDNAIQTVSAQRANLGALQNRLSDSQSNVENASQNLQSAESNITNVNMAQEMSQFTQLNVLQQAGASILAQANQMPQVILKLLQ